MKVPSRARASSSRTSRSLLARGLARHHCDDVAADPDRRLRVCLEIVFRAGIGRSAGPGSEDHIPSAVLQVGDGVDALLARFGAALVDWQQSRSPTPACYRVAVGPELVDDPLVVVGGGGGPTTYQSREPEMARVSPVAKTRWRSNTRPLADDANQRLGPSNTATGLDANTGSQTVGHGARTIVRSALIDSARYGTSISTALANPLVARIRNHVGSRETSALEICGRHILRSTFGDV